MLDIKWIREHPKEFDNLLIKRGMSPCSEEITDLDLERRQLITLIQQFQNAKKRKSAIIADMKSRSNKEFEEIRRDINHINEKLEELESNLNTDNKLQDLLENLPNLPDPEVPYGLNASSNKCIRSWGEIKKFTSAKHHFEIGERLGLMDFVQTAKFCGSRFVSLEGDLAKLERALIDFMIDVHVKDFGYTEISVPALVRSQAMYNVGQLPKFAADSFETTNGYRLIPTGEVPLTNMVADSILKEEQLPIRYVACTPCFRSEAGSAGKDTRGMIRMHQFNKVELVSICTPDETEKEYEKITNAAETILQKLNLPYRVMLLCSGDMGFAAKKTYDLEVWLPAQEKYREISSCSNFGDFQARRMKTRYKVAGSNDTTFVNTLNGSALPTGRTIIAILENYQNDDGSVTVPNALVQYMNGQKKIISKCY